MIIMCSVCGEPDEIVGYYKDFWGKTMTIETCNRCKGLTHNQHKP